MIPTTFDYQRAATLDEAIAALASGSAKLLAGGHSLIPLMKLRLSEPQRLVDIARLPELAGIGMERGRLRIGAATVHHDVAVSAAVREACPMLAETASAIGDPQVRNRGTLGGSLAHADPAADYPAAMLALDAEIHVKGPAGARAIAASDFFIDLFTVDLAPDEIITHVLLAPERVAAYAKLHQRASHFAIVGVAAALRIDGNTIREARVGLTGALSHAVRLPAVEDALRGHAATSEQVQAAAALAADGLADLNDDIHGSADYRRAMIPVFAARALAAALARR